MNQTVTLLLLLEGGPLTPSERTALATFQRREKVVLKTPLSRIPTVPKALPTPPRQPGPVASAPPSGDFAASEEIVARIEASLEEAETLAASLNEATALTVLAAVEYELLVHPELPQAAWLMAERHHLAAAVHRKQPDGAAEAEALLLSARALEGPRETVFGEAPAEPPPSATPVLLDIRELSPHDAFVLDGRRAGQSVNVLPGRHHAQLIRDSSLAWSGWLEVGTGSRVQTFTMPPRVACSEDDLRGVTLGTRAPNVPPGVRCGRWIGVRRGKGRLEVSWCEGGRCTAYGPLLFEPKLRESLPPWATATILGAATLGAGSILIFTGAFERDRPPTERRTVYEGPRAP